MKNLFPLLLALGAAGCAPSFDHLDFQMSTTPPLPVTLNNSQIEVPEGIAVAFVPVPMAGTDKLDKTVVLTSTDPGILDVAPEASGKGFVLFGVARGNAGVQVVVDGEKQEIIPAVVSLQ